MKKIAKNHFIGEYKIQDFVCDGLIEIHKTTPMAPPNFEIDNPNFPLFKKIGMLGDAQVIPEWKDSIDVVITSQMFKNPKMVPKRFYSQIKMINIYWLELNMCLIDYAKELDWMDSEHYETELLQFGREILPQLEATEGLNIQYYKPGSGYPKWHTERAGSKFSREFVFMTYLNDVPKGGTEFFYQDKLFEAKKGTTLIWPAHYTHVHRGQISKEHEKYIATGWFNYPNRYLISEERAVS